MIRTTFFSMLAHWLLSCTEPSLLEAEKEMLCEEKNSQRFQGRLIPKHLLAISHLILLPGLSHTLDALFSFCLPTWEMLLIYIFFYASLIK